MGSSQAHYSEITFGSMNSSERPITLTQEDNSNISDPHQECSGESSEECFPTRPPEVKLPCRDSRSSKVCHILMTNLGWNKAEIVDTLEAKRKVQSQTYYDRKQKKELAWKKTFTDSKLTKVNAELAKFGF